MKIGLLTYHISANIGALMQTYATCKALKQLGHDVIIIDIRQPERQSSGLKRVLSKLIYGKHYRDLQSFRETYYPSISKRYNSLEELRNDPPKVDCLVVGSDQTWNPCISKEVAMAYFLDFGGDEIKRFSYASSFGMEKWEHPSSLTNEVNRALHRFFCISVRESSGVNICKETFGVSADLVVDPTLLFSEYNEITGSIESYNELLCYKLRRDDDFFRNIGKFKKQIGLPARLLNNSYPVKGLRYTYPPSVKNWIKRIAGAKFVLTDSFHGVAFSLIYRRQFVVIRCHDGRDSRFENLLHYLGLDDRIFDSVEQLSKTRITVLKEIDYSVINPRLKGLAKGSWDYLRKAMN